MFVGIRSVSVWAYLVSDGINITLYDGAPSGHCSIAGDLVNASSPYHRETVLRRETCGLIHQVLEKKIPCTEIIRM